MDSETLPKQAPFYSQGWFWLILIGSIILIIGIIIWVTKWITSNVWVAVLIAGFGLLLIIIGVVWIFIARNNRKKKEEAMQQQVRQAEQMETQAYIEQLKAQELQKQLLAQQQEAGKAMRGY